MAEHHGALEQMLKTMLHESFYTSGTYSNPDLGVQVGWVSHRGGFADGMPVWNERKDVCIIFSGELYPDPAELDDLRGKGHVFSPDHADYLVHLYEEHGLDFLLRLNGWFSGVLVDLRQRKAVLFNDRFGLRRVHYHETPEAVYFASEAKALLKVFPATRQLDLAGAAEFLTCSTTLQNRTLYVGIWSLPGASRWTFAPGEAIRKERYFSQETWEQQERLPFAEYYDRLKAAFRRVLPRYFKGQGTIGFSLTGGVDTRLILALGPQVPGKLRCFTYCGPYRHNTDVKLAQKVAQICGQPHEIFQLNGDFVSQFPALAEQAIYLSDGVLDVTGASDLYMNRLARQVGAIRLTGNYGGEILRSIVAFKPVKLLPDIFAPEFGPRLGLAADTYWNERKPTHPVSFVAFKQVPWHHYNRFSLEQSQLTHRSPYLDNEIVSLIYRAPRDLPNDNRVSLQLIADGNPALAGFGTDRGIRYHPIPVWSELVKGYHYVTFKGDYAYDYGMPQWLCRLDHAFAPLHLERMFLGRHKIVHFRVWYRDSLAGYLKEVLLDRRSLGRPYVSGPAVEKIVRAHTSGTGNYTLEIHRLLTLELLQRKLIEAA